jgi:hypothetical protein
MEHEEHIIFASVEAVLEEGRQFCALSFAEEFRTREIVTSAVVYSPRVPADFCGDVQAFGEDFLDGKCDEKPCVKIQRQGDCVRPFEKKLRKRATNQGFWFYNRTESFKRIAWTAGGADYHNWWRLVEMCTGGEPEEEKSLPPSTRTAEMLPPGVLQHSPHLVYAKDVIIMADGGAHKDNEHYVQASVCYHGTALMQKQCEKSAHLDRSRGATKVQQVPVLGRAALANPSCGCCRWIAC